MPTVHIETQPIRTNAYDLIQTWVGDSNSNLDERLYTEVHEDRMYAAMTNLGKACRWLVDCRVDRGAVCIVSDQDGRDKRYGGEHDDLFEAIRSREEYQHNRAKYALIYGKYVSYLDRIRELADIHEILFTQNDQAAVSILHHAAEFETPNLWVDNRVWTAANMITVKLSGDRNRAWCNSCGVTIIFKQSNEFTPVSKPNGKDKRGKDKFVKIATPQKLVEWFLNRHLEKHTQKNMEATVNGLSS